MTSLPRPGIASLPLSLAAALKAREEAKGDGRYRLLVVSSHPVPYSEPLLGLMARHPKLDITVVHCLLGPVYDAEFCRTIDASASTAHPYPCLYVTNFAPKPGVKGFFGLINLGLWRLIGRGHFDAVAVSGYAYLSFWLAFVAARFARTPLFIGTDATELKHYSGGWWWKRWVKGPLVRLIYGRLADIVLVPSSASIQFLKRVGVPEKRIVLTPFVADNDYFAGRVNPHTRKQMRDRLRIPRRALVILYCGKLVPWKRPHDLLRAFASLAQADPEKARSAYLVFAGDGILRPSLEAEAHSLHAADRVRFVGFAPYDELPGVYAASDLAVLPSEHEAWGVVVNEAMACGVPVVVSDRVGARLDLIVPGETGEIFPCGDIPALAEILLRYLRNPRRTQSMAAAARQRMATWSYDENLQGWVRAFERIHRRNEGDLTAPAYTR